MNTFVSQKPSEIVVQSHLVNTGSTRYQFVCQSSQDLGLSHLYQYNPVKYVPAWFPGAHFQRKALEQRELSTRMRTAPFSMVKEQVVCKARALLDYVI